MKNSSLISLGLVMALVLSLFTGCGKDKVACDISLKGTASGTVAFANSAEKTMKFFSGDSVTVIATPKKNCDFFGWYVGKEKTPLSTDTNYTFIASESVTLIAKFGKSPVISIDCNDNGNVAFIDSSEKSLVIPRGNKVSVVATTNANCEFRGWYAGDSKVCDKTEYTFTSSKNVSLVAKFVKSPVVSISNSENGSVAFANSSNKSMPVFTGSDVTVIATPDEDCEFEGWFSGDTKVCAEQSYTFAVSKNVSLAAKFYPSPVVFINSGKNGKVAFVDSNEDSKVVLKGTDVTVNATPDKNYEFVGWFVDDAKVSADASYTFNALENISLLAKFKACPVVSISGTENGRVAFADSSEKSVIVFSGTDVTVTATPDKGFELYGWFVGNSETPVSKELSYTFDVNENVKLHAVFKQSLNGHEYVDLGLPSGLKWAKCNVGTDIPENKGSFYAWGETEEKSNYSWSTYKYCNTADNTVTKYSTNERYGCDDNKVVLEAADDVASVRWGGAWRMPTSEEQDELCRVCTWEWTTLNDVPGYKVTGPNGNSIFLPVTGYMNGTDILNKSLGGYYWSSSLYGSSCGRAFYLLFDNTKCDKGQYSRRYSGRSVRAVFE